MFWQLADYQEKYIETDRMLKEREASFLDADGDIVAILEAKVADLESKLLEASQNSIGQAKEGGPLQQR